MKTPFKRVRKAVFPVAGLGSRFLPATKVIPKEMLILGDKPLIQHAYEEARDAGIEEFIFVSSRGKNLIEDHFRVNNELTQAMEGRNKQEALEALSRSTIDEGKLFVTHQNQPLGLGHAIWCAKNLVGDEPFAIILPDDVVLGEKGCLSQMIEEYNKVGGNLVGVENVPLEDVSRYGILDVGKDEGKLAEVKGLVEKPKPMDAPSTLSVIGRYILQPEVFDYLGEFGKGSGGEIQLTDSMARLIGEQPFHGVRFDGDRYDCGNHFGMFEATVAYAMQNTAMNARVKSVLSRALA